MPARAMQHAHHQPRTIEHILKPYDAYPIIAKDLAEVDRVIKERLDSPVVLIRTIASYIIGAGGKRLRPVLLTLFARALGYDEDPVHQKTGHHWLMAAVVEFIHTATLLHDDVVDESTLRRGHATANAEFGNAASVLVGDFLYSRSFQMMVEVEQLSILKTLADATNVIAEGEVLQLLNCNDPDVDEAAYLQVIRFKTAKLFEASARIGAILAGATPEQEDAAATYGRHLGTAFQIIDDVLDYSGESETLGKNIGDDLREGKATLPLIRVMEVGNADDREIVRQAILNGETEHFDQIHQAIQRCDALGYAYRLAEQEATRAREALKGMPPSQALDALLYLSAYSVSRNK
ncbi:MAG: polyprenyl synthetase family protein [Lautropia sp.]|nr:polyprenyl synthetase family protein [Lautropia sp.]